MKKIALLLLAIISLGMNMSAQTEVNWMASVSMTSTDEGYVVLTAEIAPGWHMYGMEIPKGGPKPTVFKFSGESVEFAGHTQASPRVTVSHDPSFDMDLQWWTGKVVFTQKFKVGDPNQKNISVTVRYMVCNDVTCKAPVRKIFELVIP